MMYLYIYTLDDRVSTLNKALCRYLKLQPARIGCIQHTIDRTEGKRSVGDLKRCR
jgi:hypothetical protein